MDVYIYTLYQLGEVQVYKELQWFESLVELHYRLLLQITEFDSERTQFTAIIALLNKHARPTRNLCEISEYHSSTSYGNTEQLKVIQSSNSSHILSGIQQKILNNGGFIKINLLAI